MDFFPVAASVKQGAIRKVADCEIPEHAKQTPLFRAGVPPLGSSKVETWWLWDGQKEWKIGDLTPEQRKLPIRASWNNTMLIKRIEEGWLPEKDAD